MNTSTTSWRRRNWLNGFPTLSAEQIHAAILYYLNDRERMDTYLAGWLEHGRRMREELSRNPTPTMLKLRRIKEALKAAEQGEMQAAEYMDQLDYLPLSS